MSKENVIESLKNLILNNNAKDEDWIKAKQQVKEIFEEKVKREEIAKQEHEEYTREQMKPENRFVFLWNYRHVYQQLLNEYCETYNLTELEDFADELRKGTHRHTFKKGDSVQALAFLESWIKARQPKDPQAQKLKEIREGRREIAEERKEIKKTQGSLEELKQTAEELKSKLENATKTDKPSPNYVR